MGEHILHVSCSIRGASHERKNTPNQDAVLCWKHNPNIHSNTLCIAVADGHGSDKSYRSDRGSRFACQSARAVLSSWYRRSKKNASKNKSNESSWQTVCEMQAHEIGVDIYRHWCKRVDADLQKDPPTQLPSHPHILYGSTLLAGLLTPEGIFLLKLGDGDWCLWRVDAKRNLDAVVHVPELMDAAKDSVGVETHSFANKNAYQYMRTVFRTTARMNAAGIKGIFASTDGLINSYAETATFYSVLQQTSHKLIAEQDQTWIPTWLQQVTRDGSGDDISLVGVLFHAAPIKESLFSRQKQSFRIKIRQRRKANQ